MGCDIHAHIERKKYGTKKEKTNFNYWIDKGDAEIGRNYELFALLSGIRDDEGVIKPICPAKGLPKEEDYRDFFSDEVYTFWKKWDGDRHTLSWLTLAEMKTADLEQEFYDSHLVTRKENGKITETCRDTTGPHFGPVGKVKIFGLWGRSEWDELIEKMELAKTPNHTDEDIRLVFFFDN